MSKGLPLIEITYSDKVPVQYWPEFSRPEHEGLVLVYPPPLTHMRELFPPIAVEADLERYRERFGRLVPFSKKEKNLASREMYERLNGLQRKITHPGARAHKVYELLEQSVQFLDHNHTRLAAIRSVYSPGQSFYQSPDYIKDNRPALDAMIDVTDAFQTLSLDDWDSVAKETKGEREGARQEIETHMKQLDSSDLIKFCSSTLGILEARRDFWGIELATALTNDVVIELDNYIATYDYSDELGGIM